MPVVGTRQSPITFFQQPTLQIVNPLGLLSIDYRPGQHYGEFEGHAGHANLVFKNCPFPEVRYQGRLFLLDRVHIHLGSEHRVHRSTESHFEVHLVHREDGKTLSDPKLVIGILYHHDATAQAGPALAQINEALQQRLNAGGKLCSFRDTNTPRSMMLDPLGFFPLLPDGSGPDLVNWLHYEGSLTSDPYSEDVSWFVMNTESAVKVGAFAALEEYAEQEARPVHALDRRVIVRSFA